MNDVLRNATAKLTNIKGVFSTHEGRFGQVRLFQNAHINTIKDPKLATTLIHSHFAQLYAEGRNFLLMSNGHRHNRQGVWKAASVFPNIYYDALLYLLMMGGKDFSAFNLDDQPVPFACFLLDVIRSNECRSQQQTNYNALQPRTDGMFLENLLCATICAASHANGLGGISFIGFLYMLIYHVQVNENCKIFIDGLEQLEGFNLKVPYMSPPNQRWPRCIQSIPGAYVRDLERPRDNRKIDLCCDEAGIYGESKDYESRLSSDIVREILKRIPQSANLEIVFTRQVQDSYFTTGEPFVQVFGAFKASRMVYFKINATVPKTKLESITGLPDKFQDGFGVVVFVEINPEIASL